MNLSITDKRRDQDAVQERSQREAEKGSALVDAEGITIYEAAKAGRLRASSDPCLPSATRPSRGWAGAAVTPDAYEPSKQWLRARADLSTRRRCFSEREIDALANDGRLSEMAMSLAIDAGADWTSLDGDTKDRWGERAIALLRQHVPRKGTR